MKYKGKLIVSLLYVIPFLCTSCQPRPSGGIVSYIQYFDDYSGMVEVMDKLQNRNEEPEKFMFQLNKSYGLNAVYGIDCICYCHLDNLSHDSNGVCLDCCDRRPFYLLYTTDVNQRYSSSDCCTVRFLDKVEFDLETFSWATNILGNSRDVFTYTLVDNNDLEIVTIECHENFEFKEQLFNDIVDTIKNEDIL